MNGSMKFALLISGLLLAGQAEGKSPPGQERDAWITSIDRRGATLTVQIEQESQSRDFEWNKETQFVQHGRFASPEILRPGAAVRIRYHAPFFGKSFVCKVTLLHRACSSFTTNPTTKNK